MGSTGGYTVARRAAWGRRTSWALCALAASAPASFAVRPQSEAARDAAYHDLDSAYARLADLANDGCLAAEWIELGPSPGGRAVRALVVGQPGEPLDRRRTLWLVGGLDGRSLVGCEAVLRAAQAVHARPELLDADLALALLPQAAPDALDRARRGGPSCGRPGDEDGDGAVDEDPPDDVDGDGRILEMLLEDPEGRWTWDDEHRLLVPARAGDAPRLRRAPEGRDDDGDGRWNEDGAGPAPLEGTFPVGWRGPGLPLADPVARRLADLVLERPSAGVLLFQGAHGGIVTFDDAPGLPADAALEADARDLGGWADALARAAGRRSRAASPGLPNGAGPGSFLAWCELVAGVPALEVAWWGPQLAVAAPTPTAGERAAPVGEAPAGERAWARWLDDVRGGLGFAAWRPVALEGGRRAWIGGWEPYTRETPPPDELDGALAGVEALLEAAVSGLPRLEWVVEKAERDGELVRLAARVRNTGVLPSELAARGRAARTRPVGLTLDLVPPVGARLFAGLESERLAPLAGGARTGPREWILIAPPGGRFTLEARVGGAPVARREVRP